MWKFFKGEGGLLSGRIGASGVDIEVPNEAIQSKTQWILGVLRCQGSSC